MSLPKMLNARTDVRTRLSRTAAIEHLTNLLSHLAMLCSALLAERALFFTDLVDREEAAGTVRLG